MKSSASVEAAAGHRFNMRFVWRISLVAALGGLLFGYDFVVIGGAKPFFERFFGLHSEALSGWANSCALVGCLLGSILSGSLSDRLGRKPLLIASAVLFAISSILTGWAQSFWWFVVWRMSGGVAIGMASNLSPMYIAEVAPAHLRGRLVALNQLTIVIGILAAQVVNMLIAQPVPEGATTEFIRASWNGQYAWRWMFTAVAVPSLGFLLGALFIPESPRWLVKNGRSDAAKRILSVIGGEQYGQREADAIRETLAAEEIGTVRWRDLLEPRLRRILVVGVALAVLQQWSGLNVIFNYAEEIFRAAGYGVSATLFQIVITGVVNLAFTFVAIGRVDRSGRRTLMLAGCAGMAISHALLGLSYALGLKGILVVIPILAMIACFAFSLGPVTWVLISEIFPNRIRGAAVSIAVSSLWIACFVLTYTFPLLNRTLGAAGTFFVYAAICAAEFIFVLRRVPETMGKSLEQIEGQF